MQLTIRWLVGSKLIQLDQQNNKKQFPSIILAKKIEISTLQGHKK